MANQTRASYDTARVAELTAFLAQPAVDFTAAQYQDLLDDLQANILKHHNKGHTEYLFLTFNNSVEQARAWLSNFARHLTTAKHQLANGHKKTEPIVGLYLTYSGYRFLQVPEPVIPQSAAFRMGINQRTPRLAPDFQQEFSGDPEIHAIILYAYDHDSNGTSQAVIKFGRELKQLNGARLYFQKGSGKNPLPEAYHFKEGMSNPQFFPGASPNGKRVAIKYNTISPLSLVLTNDRGGNQSLSYGSYGAFLKLRIKADAIVSLEKAILKETAAFPFNFNEEMARATVIGRFTDGTPLTLSEKRGQLTDDFDYRELVRPKRSAGVQDDRTGARCPFHAHIRKANPRDAAANDVRIVRRGVFYEDSDSDLGILFLSFQRSLENQFEQILNNWMLNPYSYYRDQNGKQVSVHSGTDMLFSRKGDLYEIPAGWNDLRERRAGQAVSVTVPDQIVTYRGGLYFFAPSISFFTKLVPPPPPDSDLERDLQKPVSFLPGTERKFRIPLPEEVSPEFRKGSEVIWLPE